MEFIHINEVVMWFINKVIVIIENKIFIEYFSYKLESYVYLIKI